MGIFEGPATDGQVITVKSTQSIAGRYIVLQLRRSTPASLMLVEVEVICAGKVLK